MVAASDGENIGTDSYSFWLLTRALKLSVTGLGIFGAITIVRRSNRGQMWSIRRAMRRRAQRHHQGLGSALLPADWPKHAIHVPIPSSAALSSLLKGEPPVGADMAPGRVKQDKLSFDAFYIPRLADFCGEPIHLRWMIAAAFAFCYYS